MAVRLFLVEACGEVISCLRDFELRHYEGEGAAESLWFQNDGATSREFCGNCGYEPPERKMPVGRRAAMSETANTTHDVRVSRCSCGARGFRRIN